MIDVPYFNELVAIRESLEEAVNGVNGKGVFPKNSCTLAANAVQHVLKIPRVDGYFEGWLYGTHAWNWDSERKLFIDIAMDQYHGVTEKVVILPDTTEVLRYVPDLTEILSTEKMKNPEAQRIWERFLATYERKKANKN